MIPYTLDANDMRFVNAQSGGEEFFAYLKDSFDVLYAEGTTSPKMMAVGLIVAWSAGRAAPLP
jgi:peptidoglycan/xylan/chitin deacetylase (PgdA/CDA1 family)